MTKKAAGLTGAIATKVGKQCDLADIAFVEGRFLEAAEGYGKAWKMLPAPREQWESGREIVNSVAEACLAAGDIEAAKEALAHALKHKGAEDDESLAGLTKRLSPADAARADRPRARAPKKAKARSRRPSRPASAKRPKKKTKKKTRKK